MSRFTTPDDDECGARNPMPPSLGNGSFPPLRDAEIARLRDRLADIDAQIEEFWPSEESQAAEDIDLDDLVREREEVVVQLEYFAQDVIEIEKEIAESRTPHVLPDAWGPEFTPSPALEYPSAPDPGDGMGSVEMEWPDDGDPYGTAEYPT